MQGMSFAFQQNIDQLSITILSYLMKSNVLRKTPEMRYKHTPPQNQSRWNTELPEEHTDIY